MLNKRSIILLAFSLFILLGVLSWLIFFNKFDVAKLVNLPLGGVGDKNKEAKEQASAGEFKFIDNLSDQDRNILKQDDNYQGLLKHQLECNVLIAQPKKEDCLANLELSQVMTLGKAELCSQLVKRDDCYVTFADLRKEADWCNQVLDEKRKQACLELTKYSGDFKASSLAECLVIQNKYLMGICINNFILAKDDPALCEDKIFTVNGKDSVNACKDDLYFSRAVKNNDKEICNKIIESTKRKNCLTTFGLNIK